MTKRVLAVSFVAFVSIPMVAQASLITGVLNFTGTAEVKFGTIAFEGNSFDINSPAASQQGGFMALAGTKGAIQDITNPPDATGPLNVPDFITFSAAPNISITLTFLDPGINGAAGCLATPAAAGQECSPNIPAQSPFNLENTSHTSSTASFNVQGVEVDSSTGDTIPITGAFTTPFSNESYQQILATVGSGGTITTAFSAEFSTLPTVPEPSTLIELMTGFAVIGITSIWRKKFQKE
jgi:hypothetical protein